MTSSYTNSTSFPNNDSAILTDRGVTQHEPPSHNMIDSSPCLSQEKASTNNSVLIFCKDLKTRLTLSRFLESENIHTTSLDIDSILPESLAPDIAALLVDSSGAASGETFLTQLAERYPYLPIIWLDNPGNNPGHDPEQRRKISRLVYACIVKPCEKSHLLQTVSQALKLSRNTPKNNYLQRSIGNLVPPIPLAGISSSIATLRKQIETIARLDNTVFLTGEHGVGKSAIAQQIHQTGPRASYPFLVVPCNAIPSDILEADLFGVAQGAFGEHTRERPGRVELANHGTIFLDHVEALSPSLQRWLFQFLQEGTVCRIGSNEPRKTDTRIIASTSSDLVMACVQGRFREELYFRLNALTLDIPSLRERIEDIPALTRAIMTKTAWNNTREQTIISSSAMNKLCLHTWPLNLEELESVLFKAMATTTNRVISEDDISFDTVMESRMNGDNNRGLSGLTMAEIERRAIIETINACNGNRAQSARKLGVSEKTIYNKIKQFKLRGTI